jgi:RTX calcium-binding nonapeptide repeat (4 copies)
MANKTILYTFKNTAGFIVTVYNDGTESVSNYLASNQITLGNSQTTFIVAGNGSNYEIFANNSGDTIDGRNATGNDSYIGGNGKDILYAGSGNVYLDGANGSDWLYGGNGGLSKSDTLVGGKGADVLVGGTSHDIFVYRAATDSPYLAGSAIPIANVVDSAHGNAPRTSAQLNVWDVLVNFDSTKDKIDFSIIDKTQLAADGTQTAGISQLGGSGPSKLVWLGGGGTKTDAQSGLADISHAHGIWTDDTGRFLYVNTDGSGAANLKIQVNTANMTLGNLVGVVAAPVVGLDEAAVREDINLSADGNMLANDTAAVTGDMLTVSAVKFGALAGTDNGTTITSVGAYGTLVHQGHRRL